MLRHAALLLVVAGCSQSSAAPAKVDELPFRYIICNGKGEDCFTSARFQSLQFCEEYRALGEMKCDRSQPGRLACQANTTPSNEAVAHCTK